jgi:hypothetical protein
VVYLFQNSTTDLDVIFEDAQYSHSARAKHGVHVQENLQSSREKVVAIFSMTEYFIIQFRNISKMNAAGVNFKTVTQNSSQGL